MTTTSETVSYEIVDDVGLICLNNPPVNACGYSMRRGIFEAVKALGPKVQAIGIYGANRAFIAGADITEFGKPIAEPTMPEVCLALENCPVPTVAVMHGPTLGGGLEVAIAAQARVALPNLLTGFPEVTLGVLPGSGGTQRGPRLIGIRATLDLATSGRRIGADEALSLGLVDRIDEGEPREVALRFAEDAISGALATRRTAEITVQADRTALTEYANRMRKTQANLFAPHRIVECIALSTGDFTEGMDRERQGFFDCVASPQRAGLIHAFFAERAVAKIPIEDAIPRDIGSVGIVGGGTMGSGIATACLLAGLDVVLKEQHQRACDRALAAISKNLAGAVKRGKLTEDALANILNGKFKTTLEYADFSETDLVIEAVFEDLAVKAQVLQQLDTVVKLGGIIATNTSYLDVDELAQSTSRPDRVIGLHFFSPAHVMRLLEVVVGENTAPEVVVTGFALAKRLKKIAVWSGVCDGFIGNRILNHTRKVADYMIMDGATPTQVDRALKDFGFAMGPFSVLDLAGLDIGWAARKRRAPTRPPEERYVEIADRICEAGWFGRKTGRGYYIYGDGDPVENPDVFRIIEEERSNAGIAPRKLSDEEIVTRYLTAMASEAARVVADGVALRPIDVDAVELFGYGFPRHHGGPLHYADQVGIKTLIARIEEFATEDAYYWQVPELLRDMVEQDQVFADFN